VSAVITAAHWQIGQRIVEQEQQGSRPSPTAKNSWQS